MILHTGLSLGGGVGMRVMPYQRDEYRWYMRVYTQPSIVLNGCIGLQDPKRYWYTDLSLNGFYHFGRWWSQPLSLSLKGGFIKRFPVASLYFTVGLELALIKSLAVCGEGGDTLGKAYDKDAPPPLDSVPFRSLGYQIVPSVVLNIGYVAHLSETWGLKLEWDFLYGQRAAPNHVLYNGAQRDRSLPKISGSFRYWQARMTIGFLYHRRITNA